MNWKLAQHAFQEQYHVVETHPQLVIPGMRYGARQARFDPRTFVDAEIRYLRAMSNGMAGMVHASDLRVAEELRDIDLPDEPEAAMAAWNRSLNDAVVDWHRSEGHDVPDLNDLDERGVNEPMGYVFPHYFVLPMYSSASSYRFRPLGPEETLMEIGRSPGSPREPSEPSRRPPRSGSATIPGGRRSRGRTSPTCPGSNEGCTPGASSTCDCPSRPRATCPTWSGRSTGSSPAGPTMTCCPLCAR